MSDDLLARLGKHVREEQRHDTLLERVARGEAVDTELAALDESGADPTFVAQLQIAKPLGAVVVDRIAARVTSLRTEQRREPVSAVVQLVRWTKRRGAPVVGALTFAAGLLIYLGYFGHSLDSGSTLPAYVTQASGEQTQRGPSIEAPARIRVGRSADARFEIVLRPAVASRAAIVAHAFVMAGGTPRALDATVEVSAEGAVRVAGAARVLERADEVRVVVAVKDAVTRDAATARAAAGKSDPRMHVAIVPIDHDSP